MWETICNLASVVTLRCIREHVLYWREIV
ncbi:hypothetical protein TREES_T100001189 [Tupaia chinensis]|uniref:Uncharacterized protein n=1 Tax=Tupaia chinensis TaxID=246437 RepID=L8YIA9_TUPCH|nr:hypothetical protein TREES_T100001189 [Tupaia chinensis]